MRMAIFAGLVAAAALAGCRGGERKPPAEQQPGASAAANEPGETAAMETVGGTVIRSGGNELTLRTQEGDELTLDLAPGAQIMRGDEKVAANQIVEGAAVRASYRAQDGRNVARRVDIDSMPGQAPSPSTQPGSEGMREGASGAVPAR